jgi:hypothetical protein
MPLMEKCNKEGLSSDEKLQKIKDLSTSFEKDVKHRIQKDRLMISYMMAITVLVFALGIRLIFNI